MALKDLAADLESFKYGITSPDKIDGQIESGVDFFDNVEGGAEGFTPEAGDLESQYNSYQNANFGPVGGDVDYYANLNPITPFQSIFQIDGNSYSVFPPFGGDQFEPPLTTLTIDNNVLNTVPQLPNAFGSDFMTTPIGGAFSKVDDMDTLTHFVDQIKLTGPVPENYQTEINVNPRLGNAAHNNSDSLSRLTNGSDNVAGVDISFKLTPPHLNKFPTISSPNYNFSSVLGGYNLLQTPEFDVDARRDKSRIVFGDKDLPTTALYYQPQFTAMGLDNAGIHNESNGASIHLASGDSRLALNGAHSTISITNDLDRYSTLSYPYPTLNNGNPWGNGGNNDWGTDFQTLYPEAAPTNIKQRGTFDAYILGNNLSFANLSLDGDFFEETGESIHISNNNQISAGLRYGAMVEQSFERFDAGSLLLDTLSAPWSDTNPPFSQNFLNPLANHSSRFAILGDPSTVNPTHPVSLTWDLDTENNVGYDRLGTLDGIDPVWPDAAPITDLNRIPQPQFEGETYLDGLTSFDGRVIITGELPNGARTARSTSSTLVINKNTYTAPGISGYNQTGYSETSVGENFTGYTFSTWKNTWKNSYKKDELGSFVSAENLILLTAGGEDNILEKRGGALDFFDKRIFTIPDTYTISGDIQRYGKFDKEGVNEFMEVPAGLGQNNKMSTGTFRDVADPGKSNHPLVQREIGNNWGIDSFGDNPVSEAMSGMVRGAPGITGLIHRNITDKLRIFRWQFSTSDGLAFTLKQFGLQLLNPTIETKIWNPGSTLGLVGAGKLINAIIPGGPGNLNLDLKKLTLEGFKEYAKGVGGSVGSDLLLSLAFPIGHPERHLGGLRYEDVNPLKELSEDTEPGESIHSIPLIGPRLLDKINQKIKDLGGDSGISRLASISQEYKVEIFGSDEGLKSGDFESIDNARMKLINPNKYLNPIPFSASPISIHRGRPAFTGAKEAASRDANKVLTPHTPGQTQGGVTFSQGRKAAATDPGGKSKDGLIKRHSTLQYDKLGIKNKGYGKNLLSAAELDSDYEAGKVTTTIDGQALSREQVVARRKNIERRKSAEKIVKNLGNVIQEEPTLFGESPGVGDLDTSQLIIKGAVKGPAKGANVDKVNMLPYGTDVIQDGMSLNGTLIKDFIKFRFKDVVNNKYIIFRAILDGISDQVSPDFGGGERYVGRPDRLYIYQGTDRTVSFNFKVYPKTKQEFPILLEKLNYLVGLCYPSYTKNERMITPLMELTMGDMFNETPGLLNGLTLTVEDAGTWEIENGLQFPRYISAQCEFKHIGKHILASQGKHYDLPYIDDLSAKRNKGIGLQYQTPSTGLPTRTGYQLLFETLGQKNVTEGSSVPEDPDTWPSGRPITYDTTAATRVD